MAGGSVAELGPQAASAPPPFTKLSPGPGRAASEVESHQRRRIIRAMAEVIAEGGFGAVTARGLATKAGVSTRTLYKHYSSLGNCLACAQSLMVSDLRSDLDGVRSRAPSGEAGAHEAVATLFSKFADDAGAARMLLAEQHVGDSVAPGQAQRTRRLLGEQLAGCALLEEPHGAELPSLFVDALAAGVLGAARSYLFADRLEELCSVEVVEAIARWLLSFRGITDAQLRELDRTLSRCRVEVELAASISSSDDVETGDDVVSPSGDRALLRAASLRLTAQGDGFAELTVGDICTAAGVSKRCFHRHFASIDSCFAEVVSQRVGGALARAGRRALAVEAPNERVGRIAVSLCGDLGDGHALHGVGLDQLASAGEHGAQAREALITDIACLLRALLPGAELGEAGALTSAAALWSALEAMAAPIGSGSARTAGLLAYLMLMPLAGQDETVPATPGEENFGKRTRTREETVHL